MSVLDSLVVDRTQADVDAGTVKGAYGAADLNRVGEAVNYIREMLAEYGYVVPDALRTDWRGDSEQADIPRQSDMERYISVLVELRGLLRFAETVPALPASMEKFTFFSANQIESMLLSLGVAAEKIPVTWFESGVIEAGVTYA